MIETPKFNLSNYQRAMLTEMGISCWQLFEHKEAVELTADLSETKQAIKLQEIKQRVSQDSALAKLAALKSSNTRTTGPNSNTQVDVPLVTKKQATDQILLAMKHGSSVWLQDVLLAMGLYGAEQTSIEATQIVEYFDFALAWKQGEKIKLEGRVLTTPALSEMQSAKNKKQLWQVIQGFIKQK
ncbi:DNA polymerase III subunit psi [Paraglaciecola aquimarina]|uniref:DNA polymerase III subunit psi n=1 Tax=Paraglaciecola algarum TaxID=3050085 RepID=A0ABS9D4E3_9ALTE|nr:DNA polymerase III subunit psi [Paraglaciecola sp. G1-23]MCF2946898.1 DNA polymerase III subunit psi [Paraglaciecola sp. G1-23]